MALHRNMGRASYSPSTAHPELLPDIAVLRRLTQSLAMLDAIIYPDWQYRNYSFKSQWGADDQMASMRNASGDDWFLLFDCHGAAIKGFAHESSLAADVSFPARMQTLVPPIFKGFLQEEAFSMDRATFCLWRRNDDPAWSVVSRQGSPVSSHFDGSEELLRILDGNPETYREWAEGYYERSIPLAPIRAIYAHEPLGEHLVSALNSSLSLADVNADAIEIGYPG